MQGQVTIAREFFKKELQAYSNWRKAFWREMVQNSVDAGASEIEISINSNDGGGCVVDFYDNGPGMDRETLQNVFFNVGATTKESGDTIGGFGRARIITCFAHASYRVTSQDYTAFGIGAEYEVSQLNEPAKGCRFVIELENISADAMQVNLHEFLYECNIKPSIKINGVKFDGYTHRGRKASNISFGDVYVNKSLQSSRVYVRCNGVCMFSRYTPYEARIVIEIPSSTARGVLTSNRDGLVSEKQTEFDAFLEKLAADCTSTFREQAEPVEIVYGESKKTIRLPKREEKNVAAEKNKEEATTLEAMENHISMHIGQEYVPTPIKCELPEQEIEDAENVGIVHFVETGSAKVRRAAKKFTPEGLEESSRNMSILRAWDASCRIALEEFLKFMGRDVISYETGFVFSDSAEAVCRRRNGVNALLLNPVDGNGKVKFNTSKRETYYDLLSLACHEVVHVEFSYHNEDFASLMTTLVSRAMPRVGEVKKAS